MKWSIQNSVNILYSPFLFFSLDTRHHVFPFSHGHQPKFSCPLLASEFQGRHGAELTSIWAIDWHQSELSQLPSLAPSICSREMRSRGGGSGAGGKGECERDRERERERMRESEGKERGRDREWGSQRESVLAVRASSYTRIWPQRIVAAKGILMHPQQKLC